MKPEEREERREQMRKCLEIAADVWTFLDDEFNAGRTDVHIDSVMEVVKKRFPTPIHDDRIHAVGYSIAQAIDRYGLSSCGLWSFAHQLDHCLFEDDLSEIQAALAVLR